MPGTTRCDHFKRILPAFVNIKLPNIEHLWMCFTDARINKYMVGIGPAMLTIAVYHYPFYYEDGDDLSWLESDRDLVAGIYEGTEGVLLLAPSSSTTVEAWWMVEFWDVQRNGEKITVVAPFKEEIENSNWDSRFSPEDLALLEVPLERFESTIAKAALARAAATGGRIGIGDHLPMLITDANFLRPYYEGPGVGIAYETDAPAKPPPVPGGDDPQHPPGRVNEETDDQPTVTMPGEEEPVRPRDTDTTTTSSP